MAAQVRAAGQRNAVDAVEPAGTASGQHGDRDRRHGEPARPCARPRRAHRWAPARSASGVPYTGPTTGSGIGGSAASLDAGTWTAPAGARPEGAVAALVPVP